MQKEQLKAEKKKQKSLKKRGAVEVSRPRGSKVDLSMMRTATGRQLVEIKQAPKGSRSKSTLTTERGVEVEIDLGGGIVAEGGKVIAEGSPEKVATVDSSYTGKFLKNLINGKMKKTA